MKKKFSKRKKTIIIICLSFILILVSIAFYVYNFLYKPQVCNISNSEETAIIKYLDKNTSSINLDDTLAFSSLKLLDSEIDNNSIFLSGESHSIKRNIDIELYLLKYFRQKHGVKYLLSEEGYASAQLINQYLLSGDENILNDIYKELEGTAAWSKESYNFWISVYKYNNTLPKDQRIIVVGVDIEHQLATAFKYLSMLLPSNKAPISISENIEKLRNNYKNMEIINFSFADNLLKDIESSENTYKSYLGSNYFNFEFTLRNIINAYKCYDSKNKFGELRESCINNNFKKIYEYLPKGKYYGEFGIEHTYLSDHGGRFGRHNCFATYLNKEFEPTKGKVISIQYFYYNSYYMTRGKVYGEEKVDENPQLGILNKVSSTDLTFMKFKSKGSPFEIKPYFISDPIGGSTTDYYQFGILVKNSPATQPFGK